jgi:hypothetical protein
MAQKKNPILSPAVFATKTGTKCDRLHSQEAVVETELGVKVY